MGYASCLQPTGPHCCAPTLPLYPHSHSATTSAHVRDVSREAIQTSVCTCLALLKPSPFAATAAERTTNAVKKQGLVRTVSLRARNVLLRRGKDGVPVNGSRRCVLRLLNHRSWLGYLQRHCSRRPVSIAGTFYVPCLRLPLTTSIGATRSAVTGRGEINILVVAGGRLISR